MKKLIIALAFILAGCATEPDPYGVGAMLPGRLIALSDGRLIPLQIQISSMDRPVGTMTGADPVSGERYNGTYTFVVETKYEQHSRPGLLFDNETDQSVHTSDVAPGTAVLIGDKGTVINLKITAKAGHPPVGYGDGEDNGGKKYTLQF